MDDLLVKQLTRQLRILNLWITIFGSLLLIGLIIIGFLLFKLVTFTHDTANKITNLEHKASQSINVQQKLCNTKSVGSLLQKKTDTCR